jgi:cytochrome c oxidase subunit 2
MLWTTAVVTAAVFVFIAVAMWRGIRHRRGDAPVSSQAGLTRGVGTAVALTVATLVALLVVSIVAERAVGPAHADDTLTIDITGHQWWWEIHYSDPVPSRRVATANDVHIPVGRRVAFRVTSRDVIHSFWVPTLQGKRDLIPGYTTVLQVQATREGVLRGQCAEFCGLQHAHMALGVVAESEPAFERWLDAMRQPAPEPTGTTERHGRDVFMGARCAACHTIRGTEAAGQVAPDLTHIASRSSIGAGTLPNTPEELTAWILDPQAVKPGNQMPPNPLASDDLHALVQYLTTLQ